MADALPDFLDLKRMGESSATLAGCLGSGQFERLRGVARLDGCVSVLLKAVRERERRIVKGQAQVELGLICQRCLCPMTYPVAADFKLVWVRAVGEAESLPEGYDALVSASGRVNVAALVEDELLLALPMVARHEPPGKCAVELDATRERQSDVEDNAASGPFAVLKTLKRH